MSLSIMGGILAIKLNSILEVSAGSIKKVGPGPKYSRSNTNVTPLYNTFSGVLQLYCKIRLLV
jgi:hypothetical protein